MTKIDETSTPLLEELWETTAYNQVSNNPLVQAVVNEARKAARLGYHYVSLDWDIGCIQAELEKLGLCVENVTGWSKRTWNINWTP